MPCNNKANCIDPVKVSVEEENPDGADGVPVFPHAQVSATPAAQDECKLLLCQGLYIYTYILP